MKLGVCGGERRMGALYVAARLADDFKVADHSILNDLAGKVIRFFHVCDIALDALYGFIGCAPSSRAAAGYRGSYRAGFSENSRAGFFWQSVGCQHVNAHTQNLSQFHANGTDVKQRCFWR